MIVLYKGGRGRGKTLSMVKDGYKFYKNGYRIISNFNLKFGEHLDNINVLNLNKDSDIFNCVLILDEVQLFFDSRNFKSKFNINFSNFIQQIRKRNIIILAATQYVNTIDLRLRQHIDILAFPSYDKLTGFCSVDYYDLTKLEDIDFDLSVDISPVTVSFYGPDVFDLYNTYEMLK